MERCVAKVRRKNKGVNPYSVCYTAIMGKRKKKRKKRKK